VEHLKQSPSSQFNNCQVDRLHFK